MEAVKVLLVIFSTILWVQGAKDGDDIGRPYEFGFTIDGEQHRHEKKDANGIIQGEFGFITADGVYHVTVYATDENGSFRILSMKNIKISPPLDGSKDYSPSNAQYKQPQIPGQSPPISGQSPSIPGQSPAIPGQSPPNPGAPAKLQNLPSTTTFRTTVLTTPRPLAISTTVQGPYTFTTLSTIKPGCAGCGYVTQPAKFEFQNPAVRDKEQKLSNQNLNRPSPQPPPILPPYNQNPSTQPPPIQYTLAQNPNPQSPSVPPNTENVNPQPPSYQNPNNQVLNPQVQSLNQFPNPQPPSYQNPNNQVSNPQVQSLNQFPNPQPPSYQNPNNQVSNPQVQSLNQFPSPQPPGLNNQNPVFNQAPVVEIPPNNQNQLVQISQPPSSNENPGQPPSFQNPSGFPAPVNTLQPPGGAENPQGQASTPASVAPNYPEYGSNDVNEPPSSYNQNLPQQIQNLSPISRVDSIDVSNGVINVPNNPPIQIVDKYPGMTEGLPEGITEGDITDLLYKFNYTVGFHGHYEKGWRNGTKIGGYFVNGRDGISRIVTYVADEFGYRPKFRLVNLGFDSPDTPKEDTEKKFGLKSFEFVWYPLK